MQPPQWDLRAQLAAIAGAATILTLATLALGPRQGLVAGSLIIMTIVLHALMLRLSAWGFLPTPMPVWRCLVAAIETFVIGFAAYSAAVAGLLPPWLSIALAAVVYVVGVKLVLRIGVVQAHLVAGGAAVFALAALLLLVCVVGVTVYWIV